MRRHAGSLLLLAMGAGLGQATASSYVFIVTPNLGYTNPGRNLTFTSGPSAPSNPQTPSAYASGVKCIKQGDAALTTLYGWDPSTGVPRIGIQAFNILTPPSFGSLSTPVSSGGQATCSFGVDTASWTDRLEAPVTATVSYTVTNFSGLTSTPCSATIKVLPNLKPVLQCAVEPVLDLFSKDGRTRVLGDQDGKAKLVLDLSGSTDADGDALTYAVNGNSNVSAVAQTPGSAVFNVTLRKPSYYDSIWMEVSVREPDLTVDGSPVSGLRAAQQLSSIEVLKPDQVMDLLAAAYGSSGQHGQLRSTFLAQLRVLRKHLAADARPKRLPKNLRSAAQTNLRLLLKLAGNAPGCSPEKRAQLVDVLAQLGDLLAK